MVARNISIVGAIMLLLFSVGKVHPAGNTLDIEAELSRPGVKLVVVEFYATWCKPCMEAVPKWKALHARYKKSGLRFIVVSADEGVCSKPPEWSPDKTICDPDGALQQKMGVKTLPTSFLYSWEGKLAMKSHHVGPVDEAIRSYFTDTHYKVEVDPVEVIGDKYAIGGNPERVRDEVVAQLRKKSKLDVVSERRRATRRGSSDVCSVEFPANSTLRIKLMGYQTGERMLTLELEKDGCIKAQATHPYTGEGFNEDWSSLRRAIRRAVSELLTQIIRVRSPELVGGEIGGGDDWFSGGELAVLRFESEPKGATVLVDNQPACDATPCSKSFPMGMHTIAMLKTDYVTKSESLNIDSDRTLQWELTPNFGWLTVSGLPEGLDVKIDNQVVGKTPLPKHRLSPGRHRVEIASRCYYPLKSTQTIQRNKTSRWKPQIKAREAGLDVRAVDEDGNDLRADVFVDGVKVGRAPGRFKMNICAQKMQIKSQGYGDFEQDLSLQEKQMLRVQAVLKGGAFGDMVRIPAGTFTMGTAESDIDTTCRHQKAEGYTCDRDWFSDEKPQRQVYVGAFSIDKHEVTVDEYRACLTVGKCSKPRISSDNKYCNWGSSRSGKHPINCVDWSQASAYCEWAGKRLPTEAEWEKAARGTDGRLYSWGNQAPSCDRVVWGDGKRTDGCGKDSTWPVCSKARGNSPYGLCDMSGNVWEWVSDWYGKNYYGSAPKRNPHGPNSGSARVVRGGSWFNTVPVTLRAALRNRYDPPNWFYYVGFRCASSSH